MIKRNKICNIFIQYDNNIIESLVKYLPIYLKYLDIVELYQPRYTNDKFNYDLTRGSRVDSKLLKPLLFDDQFCQNSHDAL